MRVFAKVVTVTEAPLGTTLALAATAGDTQITVEDVSKLYWPAGGLQIGDETTESRIYAIDSAADPDVDVIDTDEDADASEGTLTLSSALTNSYDEDTSVIQFPTVTIKEATVQHPDQEEELVLRVPQGLADRLETDIRTDPDGPTSETVELEESEGEWLIADVIGEETLTVADVDTRNYVTADSVVVTSTDVDNPDVLATMTLDLPSDKYQVQVWASFVTEIGGTGTNVNTGVDDGGFDITTGLTGLGAVAPSGGHLLVSSPVIIFQPPAPTIPTPGLHTFRLTAYLTSAGSSTATAIRFLAALV